MILDAIVHILNRPVHDVLHVVDFNCLIRVGKGENLFLGILNDEAAFFLELECG